MYEYNNITKIVKIIILDNNLYKWYIDLLKKNEYFKEFIKQYNNDSNDILKEYLFFCFKRKRDYFMTKDYTTSFFEPIFGNVFMFSLSTTIDEYNRRMQGNLMKHRLTPNLHHLIYSIYIKSRKL